MTAQEWLDELERLRKAATPGPWDVSQKNSTVYDNYGDSVCDTQQTHNSQNNLAYIVAACNAVPRMVEMLRIAVSLIEAQNAQRARKGEKMPEGDVMQLIFTLTEPKE
ncbi:hypothetical protein [Bilophila wadsworthia]|uniref:hypothetical protein n=1 Tax=Bilophila wadsworthia TaxID=35833 RepID=UPI0026DEF7AC|nr:hypothetical protein [Bilophila wadsworthia]